MLNELLEDDDIFDFIVMDGNGCLYATLQGNTRTILLKFTVDLTYPSKKHRPRRPASSIRFRSVAHHNGDVEVSATSCQHSFKGISV